MSFSDTDSRRRNEKFLHDRPEYLGTDSEGIEILTDDDEIVSAQQVAQEVWAVASRLVPSPVRQITVAGSGANSRVYKIACRDACYALKQYPQRAGDERDRLESEWRCLTLLAAQGLSQAPWPVARDSRAQYMLMEWVAGEPVIAHRTDDLEAALDFIVAVFGLSELPEAAQIGEASEACPTIRRIVEQIEQRLAAFGDDEVLAAFLRGRLLPTYRRALRAAEESVAGSEDARESAFEVGYTRLVPADLGFHNALRHPDGHLRFVDFDYFGWDDPVKFAADFLLHPAMTLTAADRARIIARMSGALPQDVLFCQRLRGRLGLFCVRWALILLNPFRIDRRSALPLTADACEALMEDRIARAGAMLSQADTIE